MDGLVKIEVSKNGAKALRAVAADMVKSRNQILLENLNLRSVVKAMKDDLGPKADKILQILDKVHDKTEESSLSLMQLERKLGELAKNIEDFCDGANS